MKAKILQKIASDDLLEARESDEIVLVCAVEKLERNVKNTLLVDFDFQIIDSANKHRMKESQRTKNPLLIASL